MVNRVVATKLTDEEHSKLLDLCNKEGCTPSAFIKKILLKNMDSEKNVVPDKTMEELKRFVGVRRREIGLD